MDDKIKFKRIQCLDRALDIVALVSGSKHGLTMNEIAQNAGLKQATAYNIVKTLSSRGFLENNNGRYCIGASLGMAASRWDIEASLPRMLESLLKEIQVETGDTVCVAVMRKRKTEIISYHEGNHNINVRFIHTEWNYPLHIASGRILVAFGEQDLWDEFISDYLKSGSVAEPEKDWDKARWREHLFQIRQSGYSIIYRDSVIYRTSAAAAPLFSPAGNLIAAVAVSCPPEKGSDEHLEKMKNSILKAIKNYSF